MYAFLLWSAAVGWLQEDGRRLGVATMVARDVAVTARHVLPTDPLGSQLALDGGGTTCPIVAWKMVEGAGISADVAYVRVSCPKPRAFVKIASTRTSSGELVHLYFDAFGKPRHERCSFIGAALLVATCQAPPGTSGSPLFVYNALNPRQPFRLVGLIHGMGVPPDVDGLPDIRRAYALGVRVDSMEVFD